MYKLNLMRQQGLVSRFKNIGNILVEYNSKRLKDLNPRELANAIWSLAKLDHHNKEFEEKWLDIASGKSLNEFNYQELMDIIWSFAELKRRRNVEEELEYEDHLIYEQLLSEYVLDQLDEFNYKELVNILRSCIIFREVNQDFVDKWINVASQKSLDVLNNDDLATLMYYFGKLSNGYYCDTDESKYREYLEELVRSTLDRAEKLNIKQIIDIIEGFDNLDSYREDLIFKVQDIVIDKLNEITLPQLLTILSSVNLEDDFPHFHEQLVNKVISMLDNLNIKELVNFASNIYLDKDNFLPAWEAICIKELNKFTTQELVTTIDIFSRFQFKQGGFIGAWINEANRRLDEFTTEQLLNTIEYISKLNYCDIKFEKAWINEANRRLSEFSSRQLIRSINAFASLGHVFAERIDKQKLKECSHQELEVVLRSLSNNTPFNKRLTSILIDTKYIETNFVSKENKRRGVSFNPNEYTSEVSNFVQRVTPSKPFSPQPGPSYL